MKICVLIFVPLLISMSFSFGQNRYLKIGDIIPSVFFDVSNYTHPKANMEGFRGKYVIIDLWGTYCGGCIQMIPYMQQLQQQYKNRLQVILVTKNTKSEVEQLAKHSENVRNDTLPSVMGDSAFAGLFDYRWLPTYVWVDPNGIIRYITGPEAVTDSNVYSFVSGERLLVKEKKDIWINDEDPAIVAWYPYTQIIGIYSYLAPRSEYHMAGGQTRVMNREGNISHIRNDASSMSNLYIMAYQMDGHYICNERVFLRIKDSSFFLPKEINGKSPSFIYELISNNNAPTLKVYRHMQQELDLFCNTHSYLQKQELTCYILKQASKTNGSIRAKDMTLHPEANVNAKQGTYNAINVDWGTVWSNISYAHYAPHQLIDESGINPQLKVDFKFNRKHWDNIPLLNEELKPYGLYVSIEKRLLDCIIITDDN